MNIHNNFLKVIKIEENDFKKKNTILLIQIYNKNILSQYIYFCFST